MEEFEAAGEKKEKIEIPSSEMEKVEKRVVICCSTRLSSLLISITTTKNYLIIKCPGFRADMNKV